jgi:hypothetical protein
MSEADRYNRDELDRLWKFNYEQLAKAPTEPNARLREARFVMQAKVAWETQRYMRITTAATVVMSIATIVQAIGTFYR